MKCLIVLMMLLAVLAVPAVAAPKKAAPKPCTHCNHQTHPQCNTPLASRFTLALRLENRWDLEQTCPTPTTPTPPHEHKDPAVGSVVGYLEVNPHLRLFGTVGYDFTHEGRVWSIGAEAPVWSVAW